MASATAARTSQAGWMRAYVTTRGCYAVAPGLGKRDLDDAVTTYARRASAPRRRRAGLRQTLGAITGTVAGADERSVPGSLTSAVASAALTGGSAT